MKGIQKDINSDEGPEIEAAWSTEINRRIAEIESGKAQTASWDEARARIKAALATVVIRLP